MRLIRTVIAAALGAALLAPTMAAAGGRPALLVDDDREQCPHARFTSIQAAVDAAHANDVIKVCPGLYTEAITVDKPLEIEGDGAPLGAIDCFASSLPALPATDYVILEPTGPVGFTLDADDIDLAEFVVRNPSGAATLTGVVTRDDHSGYRVQRNLFIGNRLAVWFGTGRDPESRELSRLDHNCIRGGSWGVTDSSLSFVKAALNNARIDHNHTFGVLQRTYEALNAPDSLVYDGNISRLDNTVYTISGSTRTQVIENVVDRARIGLEIGRLEANTGLQVVGNTFPGDAGVASPRTLTAIGFNPPASGNRNTGVTVAGNTITGYTIGITIGGPPGAVLGSLKDSVIVGNTITGSRLSAIRFRARNTGISVYDNTLNGSAANGIHAECGSVPGTETEACPTGNSFHGNVMLGNGIYDARDDTGVGPGGVPRPLQNTWVDNTCEKDLPAGLLCVLP